VPDTAAACRSCHLPISDVRRSSARTPADRSWPRAVATAVTGLLLYTGVVAWSAWQLPATLPFVAPAAVAGAALHAVKRRPVLGLLAFGVLVAGLPFLLAPALGTGALSDLAEWINDPQW
jgi:hypothetical protein